MSRKGDITASQASIASAFAEALAADFREHGVGAIAKLREKDVAAYLRLVAAVEPKEVSATPFSDLSDEETRHYLDILERLSKEHPQEF